MKISRVKNKLLLLKYLKPRWALARIINQLKQHSGFIAWQRPQTTWDKIQLNQLMSVAPDYLTYIKTKTSRFFINPQTGSSIKVLLQQHSQYENAIHQAEQIMQGHFSFFNKQIIATSVMPKWHHNPCSHQDYFSNQHWSRLNEFAKGDVKCVWELSRFSWAYSLIRAYLLTHDEKYAEHFWLLFENWIQANPPNTGINWKCGQEVAIRMLAVIYALFGFVDARATTNARIQLCLTAIVVMSSRIAAHTAYAISQNNNHAISEGAALWIVGTLFAEFKQAPHWRHKGLSILTQAAKTLIDDDGCFAQYSVNYHRLMLQWYLQIIQLAKINQQQLPAILKQKIFAAYRWLYELVDSQSGKAPNIGSNDGALLLPLNLCDYQDYRPTLQAMSVLLEEQKCFTDGPWNEDSIWLFAKPIIDTPTAPHTPKPRTESLAGFYTYRDQQQYLCLRAPHFQFRPSQADALHVDLWWQGINILQDPGTYSYHPVDNKTFHFAHAKYHNSVTCNEQSPMQLISPFLWLPWISVDRNFASVDNENQLHFDQFDMRYALGANTIYHQRAIIHDRFNSLFIIIDHLTCTSEVWFQSHYLLPDVPVIHLPEKSRLTLKTDSGPYFISVNGGDAATQIVVSKGSETGYGWTSDGYFSLQPAKALLTRVQGREARFISCFSPNQLNTHRLRNLSTIEYCNQSLALKLNPVGQPTIIESYQQTGLKLSTC